MSKAFCAALLLALAVPAWAGVNNMKESRTVKSDEGILVTNVYCGHPVKFLQLYASGAKSTGFWGALKFAEVSTCQPGIHTQPMKAGRYYIGLLGGYPGDGLKIPEEDAVQFEIEAGKLNYIGDVYVGELWTDPKIPQEIVNAIAGHPFSILYDEARARAELQAQYPWLLQRHEFKGAIAQTARDRHGTAAAATATETPSP